MREAVIVPFARTPIGKAYRGVLNNSQAKALAGIAIHHVLERSAPAPEDADM